MRLPTFREKTLFKEFSGKKAPWCILWEAPYFFWGRWQGITLWKLIVQRDLSRTDVVLHEMVHVKQFKYLVGYIKYFYYLAKYGYRENPMEVEAKEVQNKFKAA